MAILEDKIQVWDDPRFLQGKGQGKSQGNSEDQQIVRSMCES